MSLNHITDNNIQTLVNNAKLSKSETESKYSNDPRYNTQTVQDLTTQEVETPEQEKKEIQQMPSAAESIVSEPNATQTIDTPETSQNEVSVLDETINEVNPDIYAEIKAANMETFSIQQKAAKADLGPVLKLEPRDRKSDNDDSKGFISLVALIGVIAAFSSIVVLAVLYFINK